MQRLPKFLLELYVRLSRAHQDRLNGPMREVGDKFLQGEFRNFKKNYKDSNPQHMVNFTNEWT